MTIEQVVDAFASIVDDAAIFDFGDGDVFTIMGVDYLSWLKNDIYIF
jgi:hypothetical protein